MKKILQFIVILLGMLIFPAVAYAQDIYADVNGDHEVNIADVNAIINVILGGSGNNAPADVNGDHEVNIADVNVVINIILGCTPPSQEHEWVDLGLPSGTLWATCNVGANTPEEYGDYFAWGETAPKNYYDWSTYKWCKGSYNTLTKYCTESDYGYNGFTDGKKELDASDDAATANWGSGARMPSSEQIQELRDNCSWQWTQRNGVYGQQGTGLNGSTIFLPATGYFWYGLLYHAGMDGSYWSRTLRPSNSDLAYNLLVTSGHGYQYYNFRDYGHTVRAVRVF